MCNKALDNHAHALGFVPDYCKSQKVYKNAVDTYPFAIQFKIFSKNSFMLKYCLGRYKTQEMCVKAVASFLPALKVVLDWFVTNKMISLFREEIGACAAIHTSYIMYVYNRV